MQVGGNAAWLLVLPSPDPLTYRPADVCLSDKCDIPIMDSETSYQPLDRRKVYEQIAEQLLAQIGSRRLKPGDALPSERELTQSFGVGRSSIREALRMLESRGVITTANGGAFVVADAANPLESSLRLLFALDDQAGMHDLFELRRILECEAAALAAERHSEAHLAEMDAAIEAMAASLEASGHDQSFIEADLRFHLALANATGNRLVLHSMHAVRDVLRRALLTVYHIPHSPESAVGEHRAIRAAVATGDPERARREMRHHLARVESDVQKGVLNG
jgi:GntR family transcriptional regulator, transcriptional repressor for pyruvate dehydrogenase complex